MPTPVPESFDSIFPIGEPNDAYAQHFTGQSYLAPLTADGVAVANVTFEPGCRNSWHIHHASSGGGQILLCTAGSGWHQAEGEDPVSMTPGTVVQVPAGRTHWHGAKADSWFSHLAIAVPGDDAWNEWLEPVSDEEYAALPTAAALASAPDGDAPEEDASASGGGWTGALDTFGDFAPGLVHYTDRVLFDEVWERPGFSKRDRSLVTVSALTALGKLDQLAFHLAFARANGVSDEELKEAILQLAFYTGWPNGMGAMGVLRTIVDDAGR